jgi:hypothetical protein
MGVKYNILHKTYQDYVQVFSETSDKAVRNYYKWKAKNKFKEEYDKADFPRKKNSNKRPYAYYKSEFRTSDSKNKARWRYRAAHVYPEQFEKDKGFWN